MEEKISFENFLFGNGNEIVIDDLEFFVDRIIELPRIRPHKLEKAVRLSVEFSKLADFRRKLLENANKCPVLIYHMYKRNVFVFEEIKPFICNRDTLLLSYYFRKEIEKFGDFIRSKDKPNGLEESFFENGGDIDLLIDYGFIPSSIEYCLKYDVIDVLLNIDHLKQKAKWSPFEWSYKPDYLDLLSFAGFFGSVKCFKHLLMKGFEIKDNVLSMVVCGGCFDLFHICQSQQPVTPNVVCRASEFFHLPLIVFMIENGANINSKAKSDFTPLHCATEKGHLSVIEYLVNHKADLNAKTKDVEFVYLIRLLFIGLQIMIIFVLSNIFFIKVQIFEMELMAKVIFIGLFKEAILVLLNL